MKTQTTSTTMTTIPTLTCQLTESLRKPTRRTLTLLDKALGYLIPFESPHAAAVSPAECRDLLTLLRTHRLPLSPYIDLDRIERNLAKKELNR